MKKETTSNLGTIIIPEDYFINIDINNSLHYDKHIVWTNEYENSPVELFIDKYYGNLDISSPHILSEYKKIALNNIVSNLIMGLESGKLISVSRTKTDYNLSGVYGLRHFTYHFIVKGTDALINKGYVNIRKGYFDKTLSEGKRSRIWATEKLISELNKLSNNIFFNQQNISVCNKYSSQNISDNFVKIFYNTPILLKDENKNLIEYVPSSKIKAQKKFLLDYNRFISQQKIVYKKFTQFFNSSYQSTSSIYNQINSNSPLLGISDAKYSYSKGLDCRLYRVYNNGSFEEGGRFYGAEYQSLSEEERIKILINENPVVEMDYSALQPRMIYHLKKKLDYQDDPYNVVTKIPELRQAVKKMFQIALNANGKNKSIAAFDHELTQDEKGSHIKSLMSQHNLSSSELYDKIIMKHSAIKEYFSSGIGLRLQFNDSQIAEKILKHFIQKNIVCLCVHDSFIVEEKHKEELEKVMKEFYKEIIGFYPKLKANERKNK